VLTESAPPFKQPPEHLRLRGCRQEAVVKELDAVIVREVFSLYEQHRSALTVSKPLNEAGRTTKSHRAKNGNVRVGRKWSKDAVLRVLKNPVCAGYVPYRNELHEGDHDAIIDRERFNRVAAILNARSGAKTNRARNPAYLLRGILRCARRGMAMTPASTRKKGVEYRYYRCVSRDKHGKRACASGQLPVEAIEDFIIQQIREATAGATLAADVEKRLLARVEERRAVLLTERRDLPAQIAKLSSEGRRLDEKIGEASTAASGLLDQRIEEVGAELASRETRLAEVERALGALDQAEVDGRWIAQTLGDFDAAWDVLTVENRGRLVRALVSSVEVDEPSGDVAVVLTDVEMDDLADGGEDNATTAVEPSQVMEARA
jgi:hypothetical protein